MKLVEYEIRETKIKEKNSTFGPLITMIIV